MNQSEILKESKLDWKVRRENLITTSGIVIPNNIALVREDTSKILSVRGNDYQPYQNEELMELLFRVSNKTGLDIHRGGFFGDGQKVFVQLKSDNLKLGNDLIEGYLTGINSFDGSTSLAFGPTTRTVSCQNTFFGVFREMNSKIRHTKNMNIRVEDVVMRLELTLKEEKKMFDSIVKLSEVKMDQAVRDLVTRGLFDIEKGVDLNSLKDISTRTRNQMSQFYIDLNGEIQGKGDNLWGLFSGVTKYTTHSLGASRKNYDSNEKMFNAYGRREQAIFSKLVEMA